MKGWKFGMVLVEITKETGEEICELVELYALDNDDEYSMWCQARIMSPDELEIAHSDVQRDGVNRWFYENGIFSYELDEDIGERRWHWEPNEDLTPF
jgi:hypothetical protein